MIDPDKFIITRKRKKYKFAHFANLPNCYEADQWATYTVPEGPLIVELGAGTALFSLELARRHPERFYVAVDIKADRLYTAARQAHEQQVTNIVFLRAHVRQAAELFAGTRISELWLTFSDPFPKTRHAKHRLTHPSFLQLYRVILASGGRLKMKTDNHRLFDWSLEQLVADGWRLEELTFDLHDSKVPDDYRIMTTFEERFVAEGLPIYFVSASC